MTMRLLLVALGVLWPSIEAQISSGLAEPQILGGTLATDGEFPWYINSFNSGALCGGALVYEDVVLTAAHCEGAFLTGRVVVGSIDIRGVGTRTDRVSALVMHPNWNGFVVNGYDYMMFSIDLTQLTKPTTTVPMNTDDSYPTTDGQTLTAMGYGLTTDGGSTTNALLKVDVPFVDYDRCNTDFYSGNLIAATQMCAGGNLDQGVCQGDSGGPLIDASGLLVGVTSRIKDAVCGTENPAVFSRVAAEQVWIQQQICALSANPPTSCTSGTSTPTRTPTGKPSTAKPTSKPSTQAPRPPVTGPTATPTAKPSATPSTLPSATPSAMPSAVPSDPPTPVPVSTPPSPPTPPTTGIPTTPAPSATPSGMPSMAPSPRTRSPTLTPTTSAPTPSAPNTKRPTRAPTAGPTPLGSNRVDLPTGIPTVTPTVSPTASPSLSPTAGTTRRPVTARPTRVPTPPTPRPTRVPSPPTLRPTQSPAAANVAVLINQCFIRAKDQCNCGLMKRGSNCFRQVAVSAECGLTGLQAKKVMRRYRNYCRGVN